MNSKKRPISLIIAAVLMIILGLARGIGGIDLLLEGKSTLPDIKTNETVLIFLYLFLLL